MEKILKNSLKTALIMFAVGALLSYALPSFATMAGFEGAALGLSAKPVYLGLMFAGFGALNEIISPACHWLFGDKKTESEEKPKIIVIEKSPEPTIPIRGVAPVLVVDNDKQTEFVKKLTDKRLKDLENQLGK